MTSPNYYKPEPKLPMLSKAPAITFSAKAWRKIEYFRDKADTEIGGWGITAPITDPSKGIFVEDFRTVKQECTSVTVEFDDASNLAMVDEMMQKDIYLDRCQKVWIHTHPTQGTNPSGTDEETFNKMMHNVCVGDYAVMFIMGKPSGSYCRIAFRTIFGVVSQQMEVFYHDDPNPEWDIEFKNNIQKKTHTPTYYPPQQKIGFNQTPTYTPTWGKGSSCGGDNKKGIFMLPDNKPSAVKDMVDSIYDSSDYDSAVEDITTCDDLAELVYAEFMVDSYRELTGPEISRLTKTAGKSIMLYIAGLEEEFIKKEQAGPAVIDYIYKEYSVKELGSLSREQWQEIIKETGCRQKTLLAAEENNRDFLTQLGVY